MYKTSALEKNITQINDARHQLIKQNQGLKMKLDLQEKQVNIKSDRIKDLEIQVNELNDSIQSKDVSFKEEKEKLLGLVQFYENQQSATIGLSQKALNFGNIAKPIRGGGKKNL